MKEDKDSGKRSTQEKGENLVQGCLWKIRKTETSWEGINGKLGWE